MSLRHMPLLFDTSIQSVDTISGYKRNSNQIHAHSNSKQKSWWFIENFLSALTHNLNERSKSFKLLQKLLSLRLLWYKPAMWYGWKPMQFLYKLQSWVNTMKACYCLLWYRSQHFGIISFGPLGKAIFYILYFTVKVDFYSQQIYSLPSDTHVQLSQASTGGSPETWGRMKVTSLFPLLPEE